MSGILHIADPRTTVDRAEGPRRTFCGRSTYALRYWASPDLASRQDFIRGRPRCRVCVRAHIRSGVPVVLR